MTSFRTGGISASGWIYRRYYVLGDVFGPRPGRIREPIPYPTICPIGMGSGNVSRKSMRNDLLSKLRDINEDKSHRKMCGAVVSPQEGDLCMYLKISDIKVGLKKNGYLANTGIAYAVSSCINQNIPLIVEGYPGVGKTALAKAVSEMTGFPLLRVQFYEGLTADKILYDYNYQQQLLSIESIKSVLAKNLDGYSINDAMAETRKLDFFNKDYLIKRPILQALSGEQRYVLLLDEIDKSSEEIEYTLLETLDEFSMTIPQYGTIRCPEEMRPVVILTSNNYRELSDALRRRCNYLYIEPKTAEEIKQILLMKAGISDKLANGVAQCMVKLNSLDLKQPISVAEGINWAKCLKEMAENEDSDVTQMICMIAKNKDDAELISKCHGTLEQLQSIL